jgi:hypothetical protein
MACAIERSAREDERTRAVEHNADIVPWSRALVHVDGRII